MPKLLLIFPKVVPKVWRLNIPLSLLHLGSYLVPRGYSVRILDGNNINKNQLYTRIKAEIDGTLAVGISAMSAQMGQAVEVARMVRQLNPSLPIIWGGVHPTLYPEQVAGSEFADFVVCGEGEVTALELLKEIESGNLEPEGVKGIAYKTGNFPQKVALTPPREFLNMDESPPVDWGLLEGITPEPVKGLKKIAQLAGGGLTLFTTRGCPWRCTFCINSVLKQTYRYRNLDLVMEDIRQVVDQGVNFINFLDEDFFVNKKRVREFAAKVKSEGLKFRWGATGRTNYFREEYLNLEFLTQLKDIGLEALSMGAESGSERMLKKLRKQITCQDTLRAAEVLNSAGGIEGWFSFMMGLPGETEEDLWDTIKLIEQIMERDSSYLFFCAGPKVYRPYPGSVLFKECLDYGMKIPSVEEWGGSPYIGGDDFLLKDARDYPWIQMPIERMLTLGFYGGLCGVRFRFRLLTRLIRRIALWRCRKSFFKFPIELKLYRAIVRSRIPSFLLR